MTKNNLAKLVLGAALTVGMATAANASDSKCGAGKCGGKKETKAAKCGAGKCGDAKKETKAAKCGAGKCGAKKETKAMKCGAGKCGGSK
jgi:uncharacterized low-complexity protein